MHNFGLISLHSGNFHVKHQPQADRSVAVVGDTDKITKLIKRRLTAGARPVSQDGP